MNILEHQNDGVFKPILGGSMLFLEGFLTFDLSDFSENLLARYVQTLAIMYQLWPGCHGS